MGLVVFNASLENFEGKLLDRNSRNFVPIQTVEVLGRHIRLLSQLSPVRSETDERFARHLLIPGWNQFNLECLKVALIGLGGNAARILEHLLSLGVGRRGWIFGCDHDRFDASNLSRIPYANEENIGQSKAEGALEFAHWKDPKVNIHLLACGTEDPRALTWIKEAHLIISAVDRDVVRNTINRLAVQYLNPILDLAAEIIPGETGCEAGGQLRLIEPGATACLLCSGTLDLSSGNLEALSEKEREAVRRAGYVRGLDDTPTPSVLDLNGICASLAISHLRRMIFGEPLDSMEYVFYNRQACRLTAASLPDPDPNCPVCGRQGILGLGDSRLPDLYDGQSVHLENGVVHPPKASAEKGVNLT